MFNLSGELIGIVNAKYSSTGVEGLGFAIPIDKAYEVACELIEYGYIQNIPDDGLTLTNYSSSLYVISSKYQTDLQPRISRYGRYIYCIIISVEGIAVSSVSEYKAAIADCKIGDTITIQYVYNGAYYTTSITLQKKTPSYISGN